MKLLCDLFGFYLHVVKYCNIWLGAFHYNFFLNFKQYFASFGFILDFKLFVPFKAGGVLFINNIGAV